MCVYFLFLLTTPRKCCVGSQSLSNLHPRLPYPKVYILVLRLSFFCFFRSLSYFPTFAQILFIFFFFNRLSVARCGPRKVNQLDFPFFFLHRREFSLSHTRFFFQYWVRESAGHSIMSTLSLFTRGSCTCTSPTKNHLSFLHVFVSSFFSRAFTNLLLYKLLLRPNPLLPSFITIFFFYTL